MSKNSSLESLAFLYGEREIRFTVTTRSTAAQRVLIKVHPDCRVEAKAPVGTPLPKVLNAVKRRARWIHNQLTHFESQTADLLPRSYISGESHLYLGKLYVLKVIENPDSVQQVRLLRGQIEVSVRKRDLRTVRSLLNDWYKRRAKEVFARRLDAVLEQILWIQQRPPLRIQTMSTQWGSCSPRGALTLNPHLVKAPRDCIDYVILHELCHIAEHNHSERFYRLMSQVMPNWTQVKARLDGMANRLLNVL